MRLNIIGDIHWESRVEQTMHELSDLGYREHFVEREYGPGLFGITVCLMCQEPELGLKRRIRLSRKESKLYLDIMLDLDAMKGARPEERLREVGGRLAAEILSVLSRYTINDFDRNRFVRDLRAWLASAIRACSREHS
jgi:hypothetical protein